MSLRELREQKPKVPPPPCQRCGRPSNDTWGLVCESSMCLDCKADWDVWAGQPHGPLSHCSIHGFAPIRFDYVEGHFGIGPWLSHEMSWRRIVERTAKWIQETKLKTKAVA